MRASESERRRAAAPVVDADGRSVVRPARSAAEPLVPRGAAVTLGTPEIPWRDARVGGLVSAGLIRMTVNPRVPEV